MGCDGGTYILINLGNLSGPMACRCSTGYTRGCFQLVLRMSGIGQRDGRLGNVSWKTVRWKYQVLCARKGIQMPDS